MLALLVAVVLSPGTIAQWLTVAAVVGAAWVFNRGGGGAALGILERANHVLESRVHEQDRTIAELRAQVAELQARTDVTVALAPMLEELRRHERQAESRNERTLTVLQLIADRLGPEEVPARV